MHITRNEFLLCFFSNEVRHQKGPDDDSDLSGRVKELGKMFEGGGPVFPKTAKSDKDKGIKK